MSEAPTISVSRFRDQRAEGGDAGSAATLAMPGPAIERRAKISHSMPGSRWPNCCATASPPLSNSAASCRSKRRSTMRTHDIEVAPAGIIHQRVEGQREFANAGRFVDDPGQLAVWSADPAPAVEAGTEISPGY